LTGGSGVRAKTSALLAECKRVLSEYDGQITVRQLYYRLVAGQVIGNSLNEYKNLDGHLTKWRKAGDLDPAAFCDLTREPMIPNAWMDLSDFFATVREAYRRDPWQGQDRRPEIWCEKQALATVFEPICRAYGVAFQVCRGYVSKSLLVAAAERTKHILYFGDFDGSGEGIAENIEQELREVWGVNVGLVRIALTPEQIAKHKLPGAIPKPSDSRTKGFLGEITDLAAWQAGFEQQAEEQRELAVRLA
jgi:hypothetical protein